MNIRTSLTALTTALAMAAAAHLGTARLSAASATASMPVSATVSDNCTITTNQVAFGSYDPIVAQASADLDATGAVEGRPYLPGLRPHRWQSRRAGRQLHRLHRRHGQLLGPWRHDLRES